MNFSIAGNDPRNTDIVGPGVAYNVQTPGPFMLHTTIRRAGASAAVAQIDWHPLSSDILRMGGAETRVDEFLQPSPGRISSERAFVADGQTYTWRLAPSAMTLSRADVPVATVDFRGRRGSMLHVSPDASAVLDELVVSMLLMWRMQQQRPDSRLRDDDPQLGHRRRGSRARLSGGYATIGGWHGGHGAAGTLFGGDGDGGWFSNDGGGDGGDGAGGNGGGFEDAGPFGGDGGTFGGDGGYFGGDGGAFGGDGGDFGGDGGYFGGDGGYSGGDGGYSGGDAGPTGTDC